VEILHLRASKPLDNSQELTSHQLLKTLQWYQLPKEGLGRTVREKGHRKHWRDKRRDRTASELRGNK